MRKLILPLLFAAPLLSGCWALAVGAGTVLVSQEMLDGDSFVARVELDSRDVWLKTKREMSKISPSLLEVDEDLKLVTGSYDAARVTVQVETYDVEETVVRVAARKYGVANEQIADEILRKLLKSF